MTEVGQGNPAMSHSAMTDDGDAAMLACELRVRLLETLVGLDVPALAGKAAARERSIARRGQAAVEELHSAVERAASGSEPVRRFLEGYDANRPLLLPQMTPAMQAAAANSTAGHDLTPHAKAALILDAEHDIRTLERELREIDVLEKQGAAGAGRLAETESMQSRLKTVTNERHALRKSYTALENRVEQLLADYDNYVDTVSQLFVTWNDAINHAERTISRLEREKAG